MVLLHSYSPRIGGRGLFVSVLEAKRLIMKTYSMLIQWSEIDQVFVVTIPEFIGRVMMPCTDGQTYEDSARSGLEVIETFLEIWNEEGQPLPEPQGLVAA